MPNDVHNYSMQMYNGVQVVVCLIPMGSFDLSYENVSYIMISVLYIVLLRK